MIHHPCREIPVHCHPRVGVAVQPPNAELYFRDERWIDPINTQIRFEALLYNSDRGVTWQVLAPDGGPGHGTVTRPGCTGRPTRAALKAARRIWWWHRARRSAPQGRSPG